MDLARPGLPAEIGFGDLRVEHRTPSAVQVESELLGGRTSPFYDASRYVVTQLQKASPKRSPSFGFASHAIPSIPA